MASRCIACLLFVVNVAWTADNPFITGRVEVIAHRGGVGPDSTLANIKRSLERGYRYIELDVRLTKDGRVVVLHDPTVDRTTDGRGEVAQLTFAEVRKLDAGHKYTDPAEPTRRFNGERIPTPEEVLELVGQRGVVLLELKVPEAAEPLAKIIDQAKAHDRAIIRTADPTLLKQIKRQYPRVRTGTMATIPSDHLASFIKDLQALQVDALTPKDNATLTLEVVKKLHHAQIAVWATNTNDVAVFKRLLEVKPAGIITDVPDTLQKMLPPKN